MSKFKGFEHPTSNYTRIPNAFFDELIPQLEAKSEVLVLLITMRYTWGFQRDVAGLSRRFLEQATGMGQHAVEDGIDACLKRGTIVQVRKSSPTQGAIYAIALKDGGGAIIAPDEERPSLLENVRGGATVAPKKYKGKKNIKASRDAPAGAQLPMDASERAAMLADAQDQNGLIAALEKMTKLTASDSAANQRKFNWAADKLRHVKRAKPQDLRTFMDWWKQDWRSKANGDLGKKRPTLSNIVELWDLAMENGSNGNGKVHQVYPQGKKVHRI